MWLGVVRVVKAVTIAALSNMIWWQYLANKPYLLKLRSNGNGFTFPNYP